MARVRLIAPLLAFAALAGCREPALDVYERARLASETGDKATFLDCVTTRSRATWEGLEKAEAASGGLLKAFNDPNPLKLALPKGSVALKEGDKSPEPEKDITEEHHLTTIVIASAGGKVPLYMRLEHGQWRIDLLELQSFQRLTRPPVTDL